MRWKGRRGEGKKGDDGKKQEKKRGGRGIQND